MEEKKKYPGRLNKVGGIERLPEGLVTQVKRRTTGIPWQIDKDRKAIGIIFGRKVNLDDDYNIIVKKFEILFEIRDFYKKYFEEEVK